MCDSVRQKLGHTNILCFEGETNGYVLSLKIGYTVIDDTINGFLKPINKQVEMVCQQIAEDPQLQVRKLSIKPLTKGQ